MASATDSPGGFSTRCKFGSPGKALAGPEPGRKSGCGRLRNFTRTREGWLAGAPTPTVVATWVPRPSGETEVDTTVSAWASSAFGANAAPRAKPRAIARPAGWIRRLAKKNCDMTVLLRQQ